MPLKLGYLQGRIYSYIILSDVFKGRAAMSCPYPMGRIFFLKWLQFFVYTLLLFSPINILFFLTVSYKLLNL